MSYRCPIFVTMTRNRGLVIALCTQAAISAAAGSSALASIAPATVVAGVGLLNAMFTAATAVYVALSGEKVPSQVAARILPDGWKPCPNCGRPVAADADLATSSHRCY